MASIFLAIGPTTDGNSAALPNSRSGTSAVFGFRSNPMNIAEIKQTPGRVPPKLGQTRPCSGQLRTPPADIARIDARLGWPELNEFGPHVARNRPTLPRSEHECVCQNYPNLARHRATSRPNVGTGNGPKIGPTSIHTVARRRASLVRHRPTSTESGPETTRSGAEMTKSCPSSTELGPRVVKCGEKCPADGARGRRAKPASMRRSSGSSASACSRASCAEEAAQDTHPRAPDTGRNWGTLCNCARAAASPCPQNLTWPHPPSGDQGKECIGSMSLRKWAQRGGKRLEAAPHALQHAVSGYPRQHSVGGSTGDPTASVPMLAHWRPLYCSVFETLLASASGPWCAPWRLEGGVKKKRARSPKRGLPKSAPEFLLTELGMRVGGPDRHASTEKGWLRRIEKRRWHRVAHDPHPDFGPISPTPPPPELSYAHKFTNSFCITAPVRRRLPAHVPRPN